MKTTENSHMRNFLLSLERCAISFMKQFHRFYKVQKLEGPQPESGPVHSMFLKDSTFPQN